MSDMAAKGYRISEARTWDDVISCCRDLARHMPRGFRKVPLEFSMREHNGRKVLSARPFRGAFH